MNKLSHFFPFHYQIYKRSMAHIIQLKNDKHYKSGYCKLINGRKKGEKNPTIDDLLDID